MILVGIPGPLFTTFLLLFASCYAASEMTEGFVDNKDIKIHYLEKKGNQAAKGPALLFIPGLSMPAWIWKKQLDYFGERYRVVAMDPRSQGDSTQTNEGLYPSGRAEDIKAIVDQLHLKPVVLIGWSIAVSEIIAYLDQHGSENVAAIVLVDGFAGLEMGSPLFLQLRNYWFEFQKNRNSNSKIFIGGMFNQPQTEEFLKKLSLDSRRMPTNTWMTLAYNFILLDQRSKLPSIKIPVLIVTINAPWQEEIKAMQKLIPHAELSVIPEAGHAVFVDQPERFNYVVEKFLETTQI